jgi:hypothetical protein
MKKIVISLVTVLILLTNCSKNSEKEPLSGRIQMYNGKPTIFINDKPQNPFFYGPGDGVAGMNSWEEISKHNIKEFSNAGVNLFTTHLFLERIWMEGNKLDLNYIKKIVRGYLDVDPNAATMVYITLSPPRWWYKLNPGEVIVYADGPTSPEYEVGMKRITYDDNAPRTRRYSFASEKWKKESSEIVAQFCKEFSQTEEGKTVFSIYTGGGCYGEWNYWGFIEAEPDNSVPMIKHFRNSLKDKYKTTEALQQAWNNKEVTFENADPPSLEERRPVSTNVFRDLDKDRKLIDYFQNYHKLVADNVIHFNKLVKENWPRPVITGSYFGYFFSSFMREAYMGHAEIERVLNSPYIDALGAPMTYYPDAKFAGDPARSRGLIASCTLHGKFWLDQNDDPTKNIMPWDTAYKNTLLKEISIVRRDVLVSATKGIGVWMFDLGLRGSYGEGLDEATGGYWDYPEIQKDMKKLKTAIDQTVNYSYKSKADVLMVYDTKSFYYESSNKTCTPMDYVTNDWMQIGVLRAGVVTDNIYLFDLDKVDLSQYKVVMFNNTYVISDTQRQFIKEKVAKDGRDLIWIYAPGYFNGEKYDINHLSELIGMKMEEIKINKSPEIMVTKIGEKPFKYGVTSGAIQPLFSVNDPGVEKLAVYDGTDKTAIARKKMDGYNSWYIGIPSYSSQLMIDIIKTTAAHRYDENGDIFYSGNGLLGLHSKTGGMRSVKLKNGKIINLDLGERGSTTLLNDETGEVILK